MAGTSKDLEHPHFLQSVTDWYHTFVERLTRTHEFEALGSAEVQRLAGDIGVSSEELVRLARMPTSAADLLEKRLAVLGLAPDDIETVSPRLLNDLRRTCSHCAVKGQCAKDIAHQPHDAVWKGYCPNADTITGLI